MHSTRAPPATRRLQGLRMTFHGVREVVIMTDSGVYHAAVGSRQPRCRRSCCTSASTAARALPPQGVRMTLDGMANHSMTNGGICHAAVGKQAATMPEKLLHKREYSRTGIATAGRAHDFRWHGKP